MAVLLMYWRVALQYIHYENSRYKSAADIVKLLVDIVSKNGNLLLSVPLRADGTFDEKEEKILNEFGNWMNINKEAIFDTRPWKIFGEGPIAEADIKINAQGFNEGAYSKATAQEIRFTQTKKTYLLRFWLGRQKIKYLSNHYPARVNCSLIRLEEWNYWDMVKFHLHVRRRA